MYLVEKTYLAPSKAFKHSDQILNAARSARADHVGFEFDFDQQDRLLEAFKFTNRLIFVTHRTEEAGSVRLYVSHYVFDTQDSYRMWCRIQGFKGIGDEESVDFTKYHVKARIVREEIL